MMKRKSRNNTKNQSAKEHRTSRKNGVKAQNKLWSPPKGSNEFLISTGSTLVDLAITGRRFIGGGIPVGIFVEIFGKSSQGKTVMLLEMAGDVQHQGGDYLFIDPEARVDKNFARVFNFNIDDKKYKNLDTVEETFDLIRTWKPQGKGPHAIFIDSLAAFASKDESENKGDEYSGARKAKEFSQELRKTIRLIEKKNYLVVATNQTRNVMGALPFQKQTKATGGNAPEYYASLRLELLKPPKEGILKLEKTIKGVVHKRDIGVQTNVKVDKSTIGTPYQVGLMRILFDYGIDDITTNLKFLKQNTKSTKYVLGEEDIASNINDAIDYIESNDLENQVQKETIKLWTEIQKELTPNRKPKRR